MPVPNTVTLNVPEGYLATTPNPVSIPLASNTTANLGIVTNDAPIIDAISVWVNPLQINTSTTATANFSDLDISDTHTVKWIWGDGSSTTCPQNSSGCTIDEANGLGTVKGTHTYNVSGSTLLLLK